jgi:RecA/RadA recombinase
MEFYATARLALGRQKIMELVDGNKEFIGQNVSIQCVKSKMTKPFQETAIRMSFDELGAAQFDTITSLLDYLIANKLITYSKPRVTWTDGKQYFTKALAEKIRTEGLYAELVGMLP